MVRVLGIEGPFGVFADRLIGIELADLPPAARAETIAFVCRRAGEIPSPLRVGVIMLSVGIGVAQRIAGADRTTRALRHTRLPLVGELPRMVRSLGFAYVWDTWPDTSPTGRMPR